MGRLTDMDDVALLVQHDVAVMPVLDLQQEQQEAVGGHAADEVVPRLVREPVLTAALGAMPPGSMPRTSVQGSRPLPCP